MIRAFLPLIVGLAVVGCTDKKTAAPERMPQAGNPAVASHRPSAGPADAAPVRKAANSMDAAAGFECGGSMCTAGQFCEARRKGHAIDDRGRPLQRKACMPLPDPCLTAPSCACVREHVSLRHCREVGGNIFTDDYPG